MLDAYAKYRVGSGGALSTLDGRFGRQTHMTQSLSKAQIVQHSYSRRMRSGAAIATLIDRSTAL